MYARQTDRQYVLGGKKTSRRWSVDGQSISESVSVWTSDDVE